MQRYGQGVGKPQGMVHYPRASSSGLVTTLRGPGDGGSMFPRIWRERAPWQALQQPHRGEGQVNAQPCSPPSHLLLVPLSTAKPYRSHGARPSASWPQSRVERVEKGSGVATEDAQCTLLASVPSSVKQTIRGLPWQSSG